MIIVYVRHTDISFLANISAFEIDDEALAALREYALANNLYWAMAEGHACEISVCSLLLSSFHREYILIKRPGSSQRHGERLQERW